MGAVFVSRNLKGGGSGGFNTRWVCFLCAACFFIGVFVVDRIWSIPDFVKVTEDALPTESSRSHEPKANCMKKNTQRMIAKVSQANDIVMALDKRISTLEMQLTAARAAQASNRDRSLAVVKLGTEKVKEHQKVFFVMGIMTAFSSQKHRDSIRRTWMPQGDKLRNLEKEKSIIMRFVIGHSETPGSMLDSTIDEEEEQYHDFLKLNHIEGYHGLSSKTQKYFSTAVANWDADFYIKVDDDIHVNPGMLASILAHHRSKTRVYVGCMKSGPVLSQKGVKYHEPEYWKFGEGGNKYFRHATGQIYVISKDLATHISVNRNILHKYANEDVSLGSWLIGLDVEYVDDRSLCCDTIPDCEWKAQAGSPCAASFDWSCSGICKSVERMEEIHQRCGEVEDEVWHTTY